jgi:hypothetical protein
MNCEFCKDTGYVYTVEVADKIPKGSNLWGVSTTYQKRQDYCFCHAGFLRKHSLTNSTEGGKE